MATTADNSAAFVQAVLSSPSLLITAGILVLTFAIRTYLDRPGKLDLPQAEIDPEDVVGSFMRAKTKFVNKPFVFNEPDPRVILPNYLFEELRNLPDDQLSFREAVKLIVNHKQTNIAAGIPQFVGAVKNDLTLNINSTLAVLQDEISYAVETEVGSCATPTEVHVYGKLLRIVALASGRVFVGRPLSRDEEWLDITMNYTVNAANAITESQAIRPWLRWIRVPMLASIRKSHEYRRRLEAKLKPLLQPWVEASRQQSEDGEDDEIKMPQNVSGNDDFVLAAWSLKYYDNNEPITAKSVAQTLLQGSFAAIHTTTTTLSNVLFDLACRPECIAILRKEIEDVTAQDPQGRLRKSTIPRLRKLDSFIKESQRVHPLGAVMSVRIVTAKNGLKLSTGDFLPRGTLVGWANAHQTEAIDMKYLMPQPPQPSRDEFHPWRFSDLREVPGQETKHQFVSTTCESNPFGHGRWACPGRFFANNEIKAILCELIKRYDISLGPDGEGEVGEFKRPATFISKLSYIPDPMAKIYFKDRKI